MLLSNNANVTIKNYEGYSAFHQAALCAELDKIKLIIDYAQSKNLDLLRLLNDKGTFKETPLDLARTEEVFNFLINKEDELLKRLSTSDLMKFFSLEDETDLYKEIESKSISEFDDIVLKISKEKSLLLALIKKK